ncbi:MAG: hypothetical protein HYS41_02715 [Candidatus Omnitrophica bacterium]|nr:hypothetical protein [Candidatus Omnitrophota bacterium]
MKNLKGFFVATAVGLAIGLLFGLTVYAEEAKSPVLKDVSYFGGIGNQEMGWQGGMGLALQDQEIYLCGLDMNLYGGQALLAKFNASDTSSPVWALRWPNRYASGHFNSEVFCDVVATRESVYAAGRSWAAAVDKMGDKEHKGVLAAFPKTGPTGSALGGAAWVTSPNFFPYQGNESLLSLAKAEEGGSTFLYAAGYAQSNGSNNIAVLAKLDTQGRILWTKVLGRSDYSMWSQGDAVAVLNGHLYVTGYTHYHGTSSTIRPHVGLWKVDPAGNVLWYRESPQPIRQDARFTVGLAVSGDALYLTSTMEKGPNGGFDALVLKYDESGNLIWSKPWGGSGDEAAFGIAVLGQRLFAVGQTTGWVGGALDAFLLEMDCGNGDVLSVNYHGGAADDLFMDVRVADRRLYVAGQSKSMAQAGNLAGQSDLMLARYDLELPPPILTLPIDIRPGSFPNPVNLGSKGNIPVAILSLPGFDVTALVDRKSLTFGRTGDEKCLLEGKVKPEDVNGDGLLDLVAHFDTEKTGFQAGDTQGILKGKTLQGKPFLGTDSIVIVPLKKELPEKPVLQPPPARQPAGSQPPARSIGRGGVRGKSAPREKGLDF